VTSRALALAATLSALLAGALTLLPWVSLEARGLPMRWAGLGLYYGDDVGVVPSIQPLGWAVVVVTLEALLVLGFELFAPGPAGVLRRWLFLGLAGLAVAVAVLVVVVVAVPGLLYGNALEDLGEFAGAGAVDGGRDVLVLPTLIGVLCWLVVTAVIAGLGFVRASGPEAGRAASHMNPCAPGDGGEP